MATGTCPGCATYTDRSLGEGLALVGSHGWIEIATNQGNAASLLGVAVGDSIQIVITNGLGELAS